MAPQKCVYHHRKKFDHAKRTFNAFKYVYKGTIRSFMPTPAGEIKSEKVYGLDCELVQTWNGLEVARASLEDINHLDTFVLPQYEIVCLKTAFAGITIMDSPLWPT
ncbi:unnamed protein product [Caenorhabditis nigoni]